MTRNNLWVGTNIADRYCITGEIGGGGMGRVYRAIPFDDPAQTFAIKVIQREQLDYEDVLRFQREAALMSRLRHPNIITFIELGLYKPQRTDGAETISGYYIVMEVANGHDLKESLVRGGRKNLDFFFELGLQVSSALEYTHAKNIIHRDIKPQNIIIERGAEGGHLVKVLDFGIARLSELDLYTDDPNNTDIAGTPLYMAPETSQYLDFPVDHRSDLYSLGCILYEVLAGRPPFAGSTREKLARDHAYANPEPLIHIRPDVPGLVNDVVMKLMAKHPKDRYQTAFGLHVDLQRIRRILKSQRPRGHRFVLGRYDRLNILPANIPMVGREAEFETLVSNYHAIAKEKSRSRLAVLSGEAGTGKTRLLKEFRAYLGRHKIRYISTSFSRHENNLPFNALANGFNEYLIHVFKNQPNEAEEIKRRVRTLLGPTAVLVAEVVQGLKPYLDEHVNEDVVRSELETDRNPDFSDFAKAFSDFTRCLASEAEPVAFFLDDMHWADDKSLELIDRFFSYNNSQQFFLVISHRPSESSNKTNFQAFLAKFSKLKRRYQEIDVVPLASTAVAQLSQSILNREEEEVDPQFVDYVVKTTAGNPLYVLELHRSLVTQEMFSLDGEGHWLYDTGEIARFPIHSTSIDLTLSRLNELPEQERRVLDIAAIVGTQFQSDSLLISPDIARPLVEQTIKRAVESGLLLKIQASAREGQEHAYIFCHRSVSETLRDHIPQERRRELHYLVAKQSEGKEKNPSSQAIFTLAHHYFQALSSESNNEGELLMKAVRFNLLAGAKAVEVQALLTAQRYYENVRSLLPQLKIDSKQVLQIQKQVYYALADIFFANRDFTDAARLYIEMRKFTLSRVEFAYVSHKLALLHLVGGYVGAALKELVYTFKKLQFVVPSASPWSTAWAVFRLALTTIRPLSKSMPFKILRKAEPVTLKGERQSFHPFLLYLMGQDAGLNYDRRLGLVYHMEMMKRAARYGVPFDIALRLLCDHAVILAYAGLRVRAYQLLEVIQRQARERSWKSLEGYVNYAQVLFVDAYQGKSEDPRYQIEAMKEGLQSVDFRLASMQEQLYRLYGMLTHAQGKELARLTLSLPHMLTVRHWLTPRAVAYYLFWLLLSDARELIISYLSFIEKRAQLGSRRWDAFARITEAIVSLAAGEREKCREAYEDVLNNFRDEITEPLYVPHEVDFVLLFLGFFTEVYAFEYGHELLDAQQHRVQLLRLQKLSQRPQHRDRAIPILIFARIHEILKGPRINQHYDRALRKAKMSQQPLVETFAELWFGRHLQATKALLRVDYLQKVNDRSRQLQMSLVYAICRKISRDQGMFLQEEMTTHGSIHSRMPREILDHFLTEHMNLLLDFRPSDVSFEKARASLFELLRDRFEFEDVYLVTWRDMMYNSAGDEPLDQKWQQIVSYTTPYSQLRSSLTIPVGDAPWMASDTLSHTREQREDPSKSLSLTTTAPLLDATATVTDMGGTMVFPTAEQDAGVASTSVLSQPQLKQEQGDAFIPVPLRQRSMNTMVPIRYGGIGIGTLFLEKNRLQDQDSTRQRQLLDELGAQVGLWLAKYLPPEAIQPYPVPMPYTPGNFQLEPCSWLHIWTEGTLRSGKESLWYLGLRLGENAYLISYCRLNGPEDVRSSLASILWHEMFVLRTLLADAGSEEWSSEDVQEALEKQLQSHPGIQNLEALTLSFSLLHRQKGEVLSGHFGPVRPLVLGSSQEVTPLNRVVLSLQNGRYLRYWKVTSQSLHKNVYLLSADNSKLDTLNIQGLRDAQFDQMSWEQKRWAFREILQAQLIEVHQPPYYLAAAWNTQGQVVSQTQPSLVSVTVDKAG